MYEVVLLANESVNEEQCMNYTFEKFNDDEVHSRSNIHIVSIDNQYQVIISFFSVYSELI